MLALARRLPALACLVAAHCALAASVFDFGVWMRRIDKRSVAVQHKLAARDDAGALADAQELARLYGQMEAFFVESGYGQQGADWSRDDAQRAQALAEAIGRGDYADAEQHAVGITRACSGCHDRYRPFK